MFYKLVFGGYVFQKPVESMTFRVGMGSVSIFYMGCGCMTFLLGMCDYVSRWGGVKLLLGYSLGNVVFAPTEQHASLPFGVQHCNN